MKIFKALIVIVAFFTMSIASAKAVKYPNVPKEINAETNFCAKDNTLYEHTVIVIDVTSPLNKAQIDFIKGMVFSEKFFEEYQPFTKFSYLLINKTKPQSQNYVFSKCRTKTGKKTQFPGDKFTSNESLIFVEQFYNKFLDGQDEASKKIFSNTQKAEKSLIFETIVEIFRMPKFDFKKNYPKRNLIIVSDMMQHSDRISFYRECKDPLKLKPNECPPFAKILKNITTREYVDATSPKDQSVNIQIIYLNHRYETRKSLDTSLINLWIEYFKYSGFNISPDNVIRQVDVE